MLLRPNWHGSPIELGHLFRLTKHRRETRAALFTHQLGWDVRLLVGSQLEIVQTRVCRDQEEVLRTGRGGTLRCGCSWTVGHHPAVATITAGLALVCPRVRDY